MREIGIDLGTTNSVAAVVDRTTDVEHGEDRFSAHVLATHTGEEFTPSVVSSGPQGLLVGREAWNNAELAPADTIFSVKRLMGRAFDDPEVALVRKIYSYSVAPADDPTDHGVRVLLNGTKRKPEEISAMILRQIVDDARQTLGGEEIKYAVVTVPAYFSEPQREATRAAGVDAGLIVKKIIDEPTAAAIAFGMHRSDEKHRLLVFDMGGGTLDVSILVMSEGQYSVKAMGGDMWLGGDDLDNAIAQKIAGWVRDTYTVDPSSDRRFRLLARRAAERAKCLLSEKDEVDISIPACFTLPGGLPGSVQMQLTRAEFDDCITPYVDRATKVVDDTLAKKQFSAGQITGVLLVGGSTRVPLIRAALEDRFGKEKVHADVNPMQAVALGAAVLANDLHGVECPSCRQPNAYEAQKCSRCGASLATGRDVDSPLHEVTDRNFGICIADGENNDLFSVIIREGTPYPLDPPPRNIYLAVDRQITIPVYAGDSEQASQNEYLGLVQQTLPSDVPARTPVWVEFNYDRNRILKVRVEVEGRPELVYESMPKRIVVKPDEEEQNWQLALQNGTALAEHMVASYGEFIPEGESETMQEGIRKARQALHERNPVAGQQAVDNLLQIMDTLRVASRLWVADSLMTQVKPEVAGTLAAQTKKLKDAYRQGDMVEVGRIVQDLETRFVHIIKELKPRERAQLGSLLHRYTGS